uniref:phosphotransferase n=1 Tax=uncultured Fusobacterium sp. TaxID=159267 RepID=UPI0025DCC5CA
LPRGIVHNDIFSDNVLIKNNHIVGILDFNEAQSGALIFDIAIVINYWIKIYKFPKNEEEYHISLFLKEYEKYRKLELGEKRALEIAIKKVNLTFILLRLNKFINENLSGVLIENKSYSELLTLLD